jgi:integrase
VGRAGLEPVTDGLPIHNVRSIRLHDLRHSRATLLFAMGVEAATVQRILRHSSISVTTGTYVDVIEQVQRAAVAGMDSLLSPAQ